MGSLRDGSVYYTCLLRSFGSQEVCIHRIWPLSCLFWNPSLLGGGKGKSPERTGGHADRCQAYCISWNRKTTGSHAIPLPHSSPGYQHERGPSTRPGQSALAVLGTTLAPLTWSPALTAGDGRRREERGYPPFTRVHRSDGEHVPIHPGAADAQSLS